MDGVTGRISFNSDGYRNANVALNVLELTEYGVEKIGKWNVNKNRTNLFIDPLFVNKNNNLNQLSTEMEHSESSKNQIGTKLKLTVTLEKPYVQLKRDWENFDDNERYEGFCIDLLLALAKLCNFTYDIYQVPDNKYGVVNENGEWNGLVRELIDKVKSTNILKNCYLFNWQP